MVGNKEASVSIGSKVGFGFFIPEPNPEYYQS